MTNCNMTNIDKEKLLEFSECFEKDYLNLIAGSNYLFIGSSSDVFFKSLKEILDVLIENPEANNFWWTYPPKSKLTWSNKMQPSPTESITVDSNKVKAFLRNLKLEKLGIEWK